MTDRRSFHSAPLEVPDGALARADARQRILDRERLTVHGETSGVRRALIWVSRCVAVVFLVWLELTLGWTWYVEKTPRQRMRVKGWIVVGAVAGSAVALAVGREQFALPVLGVAGAFLAYTFLIDAAVTIHGRLSRP